MAQTGTRLPLGRRVVTGNTLAAFLVLGLSGATLGPTLPWFARRWGVGLADLGILFTLLFAASTATVSLSGLGLDRVGRKPFLVAGLLCCGLGMAGLALAPNVGSGMAATAILGLGWGCLDVTLNVFVADLYPTTRGAALNLMNLFFGLGALLGPLAVGASYALGQTPDLVLLGLSSLGLLTSGLFVVLALPTPPHALVAPPAAGGGHRAILREGYVWGLAAMFFLYVGLESGVGGWAASFGALGAGMAPGPASLVPALYWTALTLGRLGAGLLTRRLGAHRLVLGGALLAMGGGVLLIVLPGAPVVLFGAAALLGLGFAPIFPSAFGLATERYPAATGAITSLAVLGGSLGGAVLPNLQGYLLTTGGVPVVALLLTATLVVVAGLEELLHGRRRVARQALPPGPAGMVPGETPAPPLSF